MNLREGVETRHKCSWNVCQYSTQCNFQIKSKNKNYTFQSNVVYGQFQNMIFILSTSKLHMHIDIV